MNAKANTDHVEEQDLALEDAAEIEQDIDEATEVTDDMAAPVMTQGVRSVDVKALIASDHVDICGVGSRIIRESRDA